MLRWIIVFVNSLPSVNVCYRTIYWLILYTYKNLCYPKKYYLLYVILGASVCLLICHHPSGSDVKCSFVSFNLLWIVCATVYYTDNIYECRSPLFLLKHNCAYEAYTNKQMVLKYYSYLSYKNTNSSPFTFIETVLTSKKMVRTSTCNENHK